MVTDLNKLPMSVNNVPSFRSIIFALLTEFATIVIAIVTEKFGREFASARNAKSVSANIENLEVVLMVSANRNFGVEVWVRPVCVSAKAVTARDMNGIFITTIFFSLPEVRNALKLGNFPLNQIAIKFGFGLSSTGASISVREATLKQKPVEGFIHK